MCAEVQRYVGKRCADLNIVQVLVPERRVTGQHLQSGGAPQPWPGQQRHPSAPLMSWGAIDPTLTRQRPDNPGRDIEYMNEMGRTCDSSTTCCLAVCFMPYSSLSSSLTGESVS